MNRFNTCMFTFLVLLSVASHAVAGGRAALIREAIDAATSSGGRKLVQRGSREAVEQAAETTVTKFGPAASRALGLDADDLVPLAREFGPEALELEARSPGLARRVFTNFGPDDARRIVKSVPDEDLPRLLAYAERADTPQTRRTLLEAYAKEGSSIFERIPPRLVLAGGLTTALIHGTHRMTSPFTAVSRQIESHPDLARRVVDWLATIGGMLVAFVTLACLNRFGFLGRRRGDARARTPESSLRA